MNEEINLYDLIDLSHVPEMNRELAVMVDMWEKKGLTAHEKEYNALKEDFFQRLYALPLLLAQRENKNNDTVAVPLYWFELLQYDEWNWRIVRMEPWSLKDSHYTEILPADVIAAMAEHPPAPEPVSLTGVYSELSKKTADVRFVRHSPTHMFGTVWLHSAGKTSGCNDLQTGFLDFFRFKESFPEEIENFVSGFSDTLPPGWQEKLSETDDPQNYSPAHPEEWQIVDKETDADNEPVPQGDAVEGEGVNLYRLLDFWKVPEFKKLLMYKIAELQNGRLSRNIKNFKKRKDQYSGLLYQPLQKIKDAQTGGPQPYFFVLTRWAPGDWGMTRVYPFPSEHGSHREILPPSLFKHMIGFPVNPDRVIRRTLEEEGPLGKKLDTRWVRYSGTCIIGSVCEIIDMSPRAKEVRDVLNAQYQSDQSSSGKTYSFLFRHMQGEPAVARSFIETFNTEILPQLKEKED